MLGRGSSNHFYFVIKGLEITIKYLLRKFGEVTYD